MFSTSLLALAIAGTVNAATPSGFDPASTQDLIVAFGTELATNGVNIPRAKTASPPTIGTTEQLSGTYAVVMVDPDAPGAPGQILHWIQADLQSSTATTTVAGKNIFELTSSSTSNASLIAPYRQPSPPNTAPVTHRYIQLLVNTTGKASALTTLMSASSARSNFSALNTLNKAGVKVAFGNYFNVTNEAALASGNSTGGTANATGAGSSPSSTGSSPSSTGGSVPNTGVPAAPGSFMLAGIVAFAAAIMML